MPQINITAISRMEAQLLAPKECLIHHLWTKLQVIDAMLTLNATQDNVILTLELVKLQFSLEDNALVTQIAQLEDIAILNQVNAKQFLKKEHLAQSSQQDFLECVDLEDIASTVLAQIYSHYLTGQICHIPKIST